MQIKVNLFGVAALGALLAGSTAPNVAAAQAAGGGGSAVTGLEEIVVTARRREESLLAVPVSVTALSSQDLRAANVTSAMELDRVVPSLRITPVAGRTTTPAFTIRGLTDTSGLITSDPAVGVYFDDAFQGRAQGLARALFDIGSVQVLKGPQGTLFGKNLTGGAILIAPKAPVLGQLGGYVQGTFGKFNDREVQGAANIPISDTLALRLGANIVRRDGYYKNLFTGNTLRSEHSDSFRASLLFAPTDNFKNTTVIDTFKGHGNGGGLVPVAENPAVNIPGLNPYALRLAALQRQQARSSYSVEEDQDSPAHSSNYGFTNTSALEAGGATFKNIVNARQVVSWDIVDDGLPVKVAFQDFRLKARQYSEEFQILGNALDHRLEYIAGAYYFWEHGQSTSSTVVLGSPTPANYSTAVNKSKSVFAQADYHITPQLTFTAGGRYTWDSRQFGFAATPSGRTFGSGGTANVKANFSKPTYTVSLNYKPQEGTLLYVATRRGYRSGGYNGGATSLAQLNVIQPEILTDYEVGAKSEGYLGSMGYRATLAVFHSKYDNIQRNILTLVAGVPTRTLFNAAKANVNGGEFEATVIPVEALSLTGFVGYTDAKYKRFLDPASGADLSNLPFSRVPKWTWRVSAHVNLPSPDAKGGRLGASVDYYHSGPTSVTDTALPAPPLPVGYFAPGYGLLSARITYDNIAGTGIRAAVFGDNLANKTYTLTGVVLYQAPLGYNSFLNGTPRTFGVELGYDF